MSAAQASRGRNAGQGRPSSAAPPARLNGQQQYLAMRASSANVAPIPSDARHSNAPAMNDGRHSFEFSNHPHQPPYSYSPAPNRERASQAQAQLKGLLPGDSRSGSNFPANMRQPSTPPRAAQQQRPPSSPAFNGSSQQQLTTADGRAYYMNTVTGRGSWAPSSNTVQ
jgi:hypothetical protein